MADPGSMDRTRPVIDPNGGRPLGVSVFGDGNGWIPAILRAEEVGHEDVRVFFVSLLCNCGKPKHQVSTGIRFQLIVREGCLDESPDFRRVDPDPGKQPPLLRVGGQTACTGGADERDQDDAEKLSGQQSVQGQQSRESP